MPVTNTNAQSFHGNPRLRKRIGEALRNTTAACHNVTGGRARTEPLRENANHAAHEAAVVRSTGGWLHHWIVVAAILAAAAVEVVLSAGAYQEFATLYLGLADDASWLVGVIMPYMVLLFELACARFVHLEEIHHTPGEPARTVWHRIRVAMLVFIFVIAVSGRLNAVPGTDVSPGGLIGFWGLTLGAGILSLIVHGVVLYSGRFVDEAIQFFMAVRHHRAAASALSGNAASIRANEQLAREAFQAYRDRLEEYNRMYPHYPVAAGPFDAVTRHTLNELHNATVIADPNQAAGNAPAPGPAHVNALPGTAAHPALLPAQSEGGTPTPAHDTGPQPGGDTEQYYRDLANAFVRREEERVRP